MVECNNIFHAENPFVGSIIWYGRYIDDLLIIWGSDVAVIPDFGSNLNNDRLNLTFSIV